MTNYRIKISDLEELYDSIETSWAYVLVTMVSNYRKEASDDYIIVPGNKLKEIIDSCPGPESRRLIEISKRVEDEEEDDLSIFRLAHIYCGGVICDSSKKRGDNSGSSSMISICNRSKNFKLSEEFDWELKDFVLTPRPKK